MILTPIKARPLVAKKFRFVGIDLALGNTGLIVLECVNLADRNPNVIEAHLNTDKIKCKFERWTTIRNHVRKYVEGCDGAAIEGYSMGSTGRAKIPLAEIGGIVRLMMREHIGPRWLEVAPTALKAFMDHGGADKKEMKQAALRWFGFKAKNSDQADAYGLAKIAQWAHALQEKTILSTANSGIIDFQLDSVRRIIAAQSLHGEISPKKQKKERF